MKYPDRKSGSKEKIPIGAVETLHVEMNRPHGRQQAVHSPGGVGLTTTKRMPNGEKQQQNRRNPTKEGRFRFSLRAELRRKCIICLP